MALLDPEKVDKLKQLLHWNPRGMTISALSSRLTMNRNLVAKYLDVLLATGQVEMELAGTAKIYFLSSRVPITGILEYSLDPVLVMDTGHRILLVNEPAVALLKISRDCLRGNRIEEIHHPLFNNGQFKNLITITDPPSVAEEEIRVSLEGKTSYFRAKRIPAVFEDATRGTTFIFEDISERKKAEERIRQNIDRLEFLARTSAELADMGDDEDIYQYMADRLSELEPGAYVMVNSINPDRLETALRAYSRDENLKAVVNKYFGIFLKGGVSMEKLPPQMLAGVSKGTLIPGPENLYQQVYQAVPEEDCKEVEKRMGLGKRSYAMGCTCRMGIYGNIALLYRREKDVQNRETVEAFVRQAGVALQRRHMREKLRLAEERIRGLEGTLAAAEWAGMQGVKAPSQPVKKG